MSIVINVVAYQLAWFACVLGAAYGHPEIGTFVVAAAVALHLLQSARPLNDLKLMAAAGFLGFVLDSGLASGGIVVFASGVWVDGLAPHWMVALWVAFATTFHLSLRWVMARPAFAALLGAIGGPVAYYAGMRLGALELQPLQVALPIIGAAWALAMWGLALVVGRASSPLEPEVGAA